MLACPDVISSILFLSKTLELGERLHFERCAVYLHGTVIIRPCQYIDVQISVSVLEGDLIILSYLLHPTPLLHWLSFSMLLILKCCSYVLNKLTAWLVATTSLPQPLFAAFQFWPVVHRPCGSPGYTSFFVSIPFSLSSSSYSRASSRLSSQPQIWNYALCARLS